MAPIHRDRSITQYYSAFRRAILVSEVRYLFYYSPVRH